MSWDQQAYSFGNPNAQPPTPTQTPTSGQFPSPTFLHTPRNSTSFDNSSGWTPTFAEEYSVFHSTPGRLTGDHSFLETATPRPANLSTHSRPTSGEFEVSSHVQQLPATSGIPPSSIGASAGAETSPTLISNGRFNESARKKVTPKRPRKRLEEAFSGQTATPPQSASKGTRKLAPKLITETMQHNTQDSQNGLSDTPIHNLDFSAFPSTSEDMFGFPMSAPATASGFDGNWDTDMSGMDMDFIAGDGSMFAPGSHKISNSFDWGKSNQLFQDNMNITQTQEPEPAPKVTKQPVKQPVKKPRALAQKPPRIPPNLPKSTASFDFNNTMAPAREEHFSLSPLGGSVDPGLLFSRSSSLSMSAGLEEASLPAPRPASSHIVREPYQHQQRELRRDQEELRRSRSNRERSSGRSFDRQTVSSPVKGSARPGLHRSMSDNRGKTGRIPSRIGRASPVKRQRAGILTAIPESPIPPPRTEVIFTIDSKGKARTETIIVDEQPSVNRRAKSSSLNGASSLNGDWESSHYESSTDEEPILVPSRNSSFSLPQAGGTRFEISNRGANGIRRQSSSVNGYSHSESSSQHSMQRESVESEAETVITNDGDAGDATQELRKVMENRKKVQPKLQSQHHRYGPDGRHGSMYYNSSINISPTALTDPDGNTPSSTRSGTTRCVCQNDDSEGFMIQCESCDNWLHAVCVNIEANCLPPVYICAFCAQTPKLRGARAREPARASNIQLASSPLYGKSFKSFR